MKKSKSLPVLLSVLGQTQKQFAAMVGCSVDILKSINMGRAELTYKFCQRIRIATGVEVESLRRGDGKVLNDFGAPYSRQDFDRWRKQFFDTTPDEGARRYKQLSGWVELLFIAAGTPGAQAKHRLPSLYQSLIDWMDEARKEFKLDPEIKTILKARSEGMQPMQFTVEQLRGDFRHWAKTMGFKDNKRLKPDKVIKANVPMFTLWSPTADCPPKKAGTL